MEPSSKEIRPRRFKALFIVILLIVVLYIMITMNDTFISIKGLFVSNSKMNVSVDVLTENTAQPPESSSVTFPFNKHPDLVPTSTRPNISLKQALKNPSLVASLNAGRTFVIQWRTTVYKKTVSQSYQGAEVFQSCPVHNCMLLPMNGTYSHVDAYIFHLFGKEKVKMPKKRNLNQKYIFISRESESRTTVPTKMKDIFNVTISYRSDADIPIPYGAIRRKSPADTRPGPGTNFAANKTGLAAWVVSHCETPSKREVYVRKLQQFISVDVYGDCGTNDCPRKGCWEKINQKYKFYLAFENSLCVDYVTEKLYRTLKHGKMIPIVLGGANYTALLPEKSFISVADFKSPSDLAQYLKILDTHDTLYNEYFQWQYQYKASVASAYLCSLCAYLIFNKSLQKVYPDMQQWYSSKSRCMKPRDYYGPYISTWHILNT